MAIMNAFFCSIGSCTYVFKDGTAAFFSNGRYLTTVKSEIAELTEQIELKHPHIYIDKDRLTVDTDAVDPVEEEVQKRVAELLKQRDLGSYEQGGLSGAKLGVATSATLAKTAPDSNS